VQHENCFVEMINRGDIFHDGFVFVAYLFPSDCRSCDCWAAAVTGAQEKFCLLLLVGLSSPYPGTAG
jgi:predicted metal-binding protein